jgi:hypothetical protein
LSRTSPDGRQTRFTAGIGLVCPDHKPSPLSREVEDEDRAADRSDEAGNEQNQTKISKVCRIAEQTENDGVEAASIGNSYQQASGLMLEMVPHRVPTIAKPKWISA